MGQLASFWANLTPFSLKLLNETLRNTWGFDGYVTSDCDAVGDVYAKEPSGHGYTSAVESFEHQPCIFS